MKKIAILFTLLLTCYSVFAVNPGNQLYNYLGTGSYPRLHLELSNNGPNWGTFNIDYGVSGAIPWSGDTSQQWSTWNVKDDQGNYYGTLTLDSNGTTTVTDPNNFYTPGTNGCYLEGIHFLQMKHFATGYQLTVDKIHGGNSQGPFPNAPLAKPAVYPDTNTPIVLSAQGANIVNNEGKTIILKGLVRPSLEWNPSGQNLSVQDIENMSKWGGNVLRLDLNQTYWLTSGPETQKGSYRQIVNAMVYYAIQNHMAVILDLHWLNDGQTPMANPDSLTFWTQVATEYKDFGTVLFELFNEPVGITPDAWLNGGGAYTGYQQLYNAVRDTGAKNLCIVNGLDYGWDLSFVGPNFKVNGYNIIYGAHPYNDRGSNGYVGPGGTFANDLKGVLGKYPIIFTEFGVNSSSYFPNGYQKVYNRILDYADNNNISYTGFAWWVNPTNPDIVPDIIQDWSGTPLNGGVIIKNDMQSHPPTPLDMR